MSNMCQFQSYVKHSNIRRYKSSRVLHSGFSLVEVMIATTISVVAIAAVLSCFLGSQRYIGITLANAEFTRQTISLRDKFLFHPDFASSAGLLSLTNVTITGANHDRISGAGRQFVNSYGNVQDFSFTSTNLTSKISTARQMTQLTFEAPGRSLSDSNRFFILISQICDVGGFKVQRNERIVVPLFGYEQPSSGRGSGL